MKRQQAHYCFKQEAGSDVHKLYIYDDVSEYGTFNWVTWEYEESETSADYFRKALAEIPENATIELHINSCGGSVKEGIAIYSQLKQKKCKEIVAYVDGFAYSIAAVIMQAADRRIMGLGTSLLIHNMWMTVAGNASELRKAADDLDVLMESNRQIFMERVNISENELMEMLENETYLTPEQAIEKGFADEVDKTVQAQDMTQQLQQQIVQLRREMIAQKTFREDMKQFCGFRQQKKDTDEDDDTDSENDDDKDTDNTEDTEDTDADDTGDGNDSGDNTDDDTDDEDDDKKQKSAKQYKLAALLGQAAAQYLKER